MEERNTRWPLRLDSYSNALRALEKVSPRYKMLNDEDTSRQHLDNIVYNYIPVLQEFENKMSALL